MQETYVRLCVFPTVSDIIEDSCDILTGSEHQRIHVGVFRLFAIRNNAEKSTGKEYFRIIVMKGRRKEVDGANRLVPNISGNLFRTRHFSHASARLFITNFLRNLIRHPQ